VSQEEGKQSLAQIHWEGDSKKVLAGFPEQVRGIWVLLFLSCSRAGGRRLKHGGWNRLALAFTN
jgi:hypothetical protein